LQDSEVER